MIEQERILKHQLVRRQILVKKIISILLVDNIPELDLIFFLLYRLPAIAKVPTELTHLNMLAS